jgi:hypothetical protein
MSSTLTRVSSSWIAAAALAGALTGVAAFGGGVAVASPFGVHHAKNGADDPAGDDRGVHPKGHAKNGADDPAGDDRGVHPKNHG